MGDCSLRVCMDSSEWLQGTIYEESCMDSSSASGDMLTCPKPLLERRLRPQHGQALKCPRCDSTHTKFCYYNNYSLSQPRYFCKACRRYWTQGGTLRNIPVGGGCRKNKKAAAKRANDNHSINSINAGLSYNNPTDLQLSFPEVQFSHLTSLLGSHGTTLGSSACMDNRYNAILENTTRPIDFLDRKMEATAANTEHYAFVGNGDMGTIGHGLGTNIQSLCSPYGVYGDGNNGTWMQSCQRLMLPYEENVEQSAIEVKPDAKNLALEWQDHACSEPMQESFGCLNSNLGSWSGMMNNYGQSTANSLI